MVGARFCVDQVGKLRAALTLNSVSANFRSFSFDNSNAQLNAAYLQPEQGVPRHRSPMDTASTGILRATNFRVEAALGGSYLFVTDVYGGSSVEERHLRAGEVDLSLNAWGRGLHDYLSGGRVGIALSK
jgi:hypothetical protein